jgi:hypothetical protein
VEGREIATRPAGSNFLQQQAKFDAFVHVFNNERPHEAKAAPKSNCFAASAPSSASEITVPLTTEPTKTDFVGLMLALRRVYRGIASRISAADVQ